MSARENRHNRIQVHIKVQVNIRVHKLTGDNPLCPCADSCTYSWTISWTRTQAWSYGSVIRILNEDSGCGWGSVSSYVKISAKNLIANTIINIMWKIALFKKLMLHKKTIYFKGTFQRGTSSAMHMHRPMPEEDPLLVLQIFRVSDKF